MLIRTATCNPQVRQTLQKGASKQCSVQVTFLVVFFENFWDSVEVAEMRVVRYCSDITSSMNVLYDNLFLVVNELRSKLGFLPLVMSLKWLENLNVFSLF